MKFTRKPPLFDKFINVMKIHDYYSVINLAEIIIQLYTKAKLTIVKFEGQSFFVRIIYKPSVFRLTMYLKNI